MSEKISAAEAAAKKHGREKFLLRNGRIIAVVVLVLLIIAVIITAQKLRSDDQILLAQNLISQFDINTTYREPEFVPEADDDLDGVPNRDEQQNGTNPLDEDSDNDGFNDGQEAELGTDPNDPDTDGDTLLDGCELIMGLDPRSHISDGEQNDADVKLDYSKTEGQLTFNVSGNANVADVSIIEMNIFGISSNSGLVSKAYDIVSDHDFDSAEVSFKLDIDKLADDGVDVNSLSVLKFDQTTLKYEKLKTTYNSSDKTITAPINTYGTYVVGTEKSANKAPQTRIAFLLDNSGSMYPEEVSGFYAENDVNFKRLDFTQSLINRMKNEGDYVYSIAKFTGSYTLIQDFTKDTQLIKAALNQIRVRDEIFDGSHIETALERCMESFGNSHENTRNIIVLLSDGSSDETGAKTVAELSRLADEKNIIIMTVGLGKEADRRWLQNISAQTGGKYYSASDADALENVYQQIVTTLNYDIVDYNEDGEKGYSLYHTGFDPTKNGFSFKNFRLADTPSIDFGMALMARDWYVGRFPLKTGSLKPADESTQKYSPAGYDLSNSEIAQYISDNKPLSLVSPALLKSDFANVRKYLDYRSTGNVLKVKKALRSEAERQGWIIDKYSLNANNLKWNTVELLSLDLMNKGEEITVASSNEEYQFYKALYRLNAVQWDDSGAEFDLHSGDEGFESLKKLLAVGEPVLTIIDNNHTVNAISLIQDSQDHRRFILQVYDPNYVGLIKHVYITRAVCADFEFDEDGNVTSVTPGYKYTCEYEGKQVGLKFSDILVE